MREHVLNKNDASAWHGFRHLTAGRIALMLLAGAVNAFSIASPLSLQFALMPMLSMTKGEPLWWLQLLALSALARVLLAVRDPLLAHAGQQEVKTGAVLGWTFAMSWLACTFWWTFIALHTYGGLHPLISVAAVVALAGLLAVYYAAACGLFVAVAPRCDYVAPLLFGVLWLLGELARGVLFTGFGWGAVGYAHIDSPLTPYAPWVGSYGLCFIAAWLSMTLAQGFVLRGVQGLRSCLWPLIAVACLFVFPFGVKVFHYSTSVSAGQLSVTLLQGNIAQDEKFEPGSGVPVALQWYGEQLQLSGSSLVIAPETAIPLLPQQLAPEYWSALQARFHTGEQAALVGMPLGDLKTGYTNSVIGLKPGQSQLWRYDKQHLVPFGEFIPPFFRWFTEMMNIPLGDFNRGGLRQAPFEWHGQRLAANICYENLFGEELGHQFVDPSRAPTIFVNVSNLAWFGNSLAMDQHLQIARLRALEFERPFVLATNTGVTAIVNHEGRVVSQIPRNTRAVLVGEVEGRHGVTPFAAWIARFGLWPYWLFSLTAVLVAAASTLRKR